METIVKKITVTQNHINRGKVKDCSYCPIALALKDAFKLDYSKAIPKVDEDEVSICGSSRVMGTKYFAQYLNDKVSMQMVPRSVTRFIKKFDKIRSRKVKRSDVKPFTFIFRGEVFNLDGIEI
jgi:hypothetical protein